MGVEGRGACRGRGAGTHVSPESLQPPREGSSHVTVAAVIPQQQLLVEAELLQFLAQFVQLTAQLLALQLLLHQVLWGQCGRAWERSPAATAGGPGAGQSQG